MANVCKIIFLLLFSSVLLTAQNHDVKFDHLTVEEGLSISVVYCILQDSRGFMWFGTQDGLNKFDGYRFTIFRHDPDDPNSLSDNNTTSLMWDRSGFLWVGTVEVGLNWINNNTGKVHLSKYSLSQYYPNPFNPKTIIHYELLKHKYV
jgi:ligand-binding sensor domain-containing protein